MNMNLGYAVILTFYDFHPEVKQMWHMYKYALKHHLSSVFPKPYFETKLWMNVNIGYEVILSFHDFHPRGQANVAYFETKLWKNVNIEYEVILSFHDLHPRGQANMAYV